MVLIAKPLLKWFDQHGRSYLPWQSKPTDPYHVWLSEIMLQQTQVLTVIDYFNRFVQKFPSIQSLANANIDEVLRLWAGLGYYARAHNLHACAKIIVDEYQSNFPPEFKQVINLPGIGKSTAGAILSISFGQKYTILDGNVKRVIARFHQVSGHYGQSSTLKQLWHLAELHTPTKRNADYTQAIMDLGATLCTRKNPDCGRCPIAKHCEANQHNTQSEYPNPKPKKTKPTRQVAMLVFLNEQGEIYLEKRPNKGIWGGLWSFIECVDDESSMQTTITEFNANGKIEKTLPIFKHSFTHYHLNIRPVLVRCSGTNLPSGFRSIPALNIGLPKPASKIIAKMAL